MSDEWQYVSEYPIKNYKCGFKAGDKIRLIKDIKVTDHNGNETGEIYHHGEAWTVLPGANEKTIVVWLCQSDGKRHTWDDDDSVYEYFEKM